jgi:NAD(P)-dependent dehydrogenase (short-subunit alcohol dehydrogenase family)
MSELRAVRGGLGAVIARRLARDGFAVAVNGLPGDEQVATVSRVAYFQASMISLKVVNMRPYTC